MTIKGNTPFELKQIILIESHFKRIPNFPGKSKMNSIVDFSINHESKDDIIAVELAITFKAGDEPENNPYIEATVKVLGLFSFLETPEQDLEKFSEINAAAIVFPFVREHLASVSMKAGIPPVLLPPVNFVKLYEEKQKRLSATKK